MGFAVSQNTGGSESALIIVSSSRPNSSCRCSYGERRPWPVGGQCRLQTLFPFRVLPAFEPDFFFDFRRRVGFESAPVFAATLPSVDPTVRAKLTRRPSSFVAALLTLLLSMSRSLGNVLFTLSQFEEGEFGGRTCISETPMLMQLSLLYRPAHLPGQPGQHDFASIPNQNVIAKGGRPERPPSRKSSESHQMRCDECHVLGSASRWRTHQLRRYLHLPHVPEFPLPV